MVLRFQQFKAEVLDGFSNNTAGHPLADLASNARFPQHLSRQKPRVSSRAGGLAHLFTANSSKVLSSRTLKTCKAYVKLGVCPTQEIIKS